MRVFAPLVASVAARGRRLGRLALSSGMPLSAWAAPAVALALVVLPALPAFAEDPFKGITDVIFGSARTWAGALLVVGLLGVGIRFMTGDPDSNVQTRNFLWGSIACIAAGLGLGVYDWVASWASVR